MLDFHDTCLGPYEVKRVIGRGGMGTVYEAFDPRLNRKVAIKTLRHEIVTEGDLKLGSHLEQEARAEASLKHPNIVTVYDIGVYESGAYIVMEFVEGPNLRQLLRDGKPPSMFRIIEIMIDVCDGLQHAHERNLVHRDIKPANILLEGDTAKIVDFGLARFIDVSPCDHTIGGMGTPHYMSPEQFENAVVDHRTDIFSAGVTLYEALSSQLPFRGQTPSCVMRQVLEAQPPPLINLCAHVSRPLSDAVLRAMEKEPAKRPQTARQFADMLREGVRAMLDDREGVVQPLSVEQDTSPMQVSPLRREAAPGADAAGSQVLPVTTSETGRLPELMMTIFLVVAVVVFAIVGLVLAMSLV